MRDEIQDNRAQGKPLPIISCDGDTVDNLYAIHSAMLRLEASDPSYLEMALWHAFHQMIYTRFCAAFEVAR